MFCHTSAVGTRFLTRAVRLGPKPSGRGRSAKADELLVQYKAPQSTQTAASDLFTLKRFRVARGTPAVELLA